MVLVVPSGKNARPTRSCSNHALPPWNAEGLTQKPALLVCSGRAHPTFWISLTFRLACGIINLLYRENVVMNAVDEILALRQVCKTGPHGEAIGEAA